MCFLCRSLFVGQFLFTGSQTVALMIFLIIKNVASSQNVWLIYIIYRIVLNLQFVVYIC